MYRRTFLKLALFSSLYPAQSITGFAKSTDAKIGFSDKGNIYGAEYFQKIRNPDNNYDSDIKADMLERQMVSRLAVRLENVKDVVGYRNFSVLSFDEMLRYGRNYSRIGTFDSSETDFLEQLFYEDAHRYGFYGDKPLTRITETIEKREIVKVPYTGQYLFRGKPLETYKKIKRDIGETLALTSGVRGIVKQMHLFLRKASKYEGNLSLASRSLAPPGYSFHGVGDFDVGCIGLGADNFTEKFAKTDEFKKLIDLGYINIRYLKDNGLGVRFEPWHIKVV